MKLYGYGSVLRTVFYCLRVRTEQLFCPQRRCRTFCLGRVPEYTPVGKKSCALLRTKLAYSARPRKQQQPHRSACAAYGKRRINNVPFRAFSHCSPRIMNIAHMGVKGRHAPCGARGSASCYRFLAVKIFRRQAAKPACVAPGGYSRLLRSPRNKSSPHLGVKGRHAPCGVRGSAPPLPPPSSPSLTAPPAAMRALFQSSSRPGR